MNNSSSILVVEREPLIVDLIVEALSDEGYPIRTAANGRAALAAIALDPPALTIFDMWLPDLRAEEFLYRLEEMGLPYAQLILMTTSEQAAAPLLIPGKVTCLAKPFDLVRLLGLVADGMLCFPKPHNLHQRARHAARWSVIPGWSLKRENNARYN